MLSKLTLKQIISHPALLKKEVEEALALLKNGGGAKLRKALEKKAS